jgi:ABC-2 type transport system permease protein
MNAVSTTNAVDLIANELSANRRSGRIGRELWAVVTIFMRDILLAFKSPGSLIMSLVMPIMMMGMVGGNLMQNMAGGLGFDYGKFMMVGMLVNMLFMVTASGMTSLVEDHTTDFTQEMLIAPISRYSIVIGKILGSSFGAIVSMIGTLIVGLVMGITLSLGQWLLILLLSPLMCLSGGALAMIVIGIIKSNKTANLAVMLLTMPQMFLSGVIIPISHSSGILYYISRVLPMTYCVDLVRSIVNAGTPDAESTTLFSVGTSLAAVVIITAICLVIGTYFFARSEKNR